MTDQEKLNEQESSLEDSYENIKEQLEMFEVTGDWRSDAVALINILEGKTVYSSSENVLNNDLRIWLNQELKYYQYFIDQEPDRSQATIAPLVIGKVNAVLEEDLGEEDVTPEKIRHVFEVEFRKILDKWEAIQERAEALSERLKGIRKSLLIISSPKLLQQFERLLESVEKRTGVFREQFSSMKDQFTQLEQAVGETEDSRTNSDFENILSYIRYGSEASIQRANQVLDDMNSQIDDFEAFLTQQNIARSN